MGRPVETLLRDVFLEKRYAPAWRAHLLENETPSPPPLTPRYAPLVVPIVLAAIANLILPSVIDGPGETGTPLALGVIVGQVGLLAAWAVLGPWRLYAQWFVALLVELGLSLALVLGVGFVWPFKSAPAWRELLQGTLLIFAILVAAQVPLWCIRLVRGWRLVPRGTDAARTAIESRQLQIRDILIAMTILALALGTTSLAAKTSDGRVDMGGVLDTLGGCGVVVVWSALVLPICLWACLGASAIGVRIVALVGYLITVATIVTGVAVAVWGRAAFIMEAPGFFRLHVALLATLLSGLWLARGCGYVLVSVRTARRRLSPLDGGKEAAGP
jgi:hypothetical protein